VCVGAERRKCDVRRILKVRKKSGKENGLDKGAEKKKKKKTFPLEKKKGRERDTRRGGGRMKEKQKTRSAAQEKERTFLDKCSHNLLLQDTKLD